MTDRYNALTVILERDIRSDDAKHLIDAMRMLRGVLKVTPNVTNLTDTVAEQRALQMFREKIWKVLE